MAYTAVPTVTTGELWTAANHNTYLRDNAAIFALQWLQIMDGYDITGDADIPVSATSIILPDATEASASASFMAISDEPISYVLYRPLLSGDIYAHMVWAGGADGEQWNAINDSTAQAVVTAVMGQQDLVYQTTLTGVSAGDFITLTFVRDAADGLDTNNSSIYVKGFYVTNG